MKNYEITFGGKSYPARDIKVEGCGLTTISTEGLENALMKDDRYVSSDARDIDEGIMFYVPEEKMSYSDDELSEFVNSSMDSNYNDHEFTKTRIQQISDCIIAELDKAELIPEGIKLNCNKLSKQQWFSSIKEYLDIMYNAFWGNPVASTEDWYSYLRVEVGIKPIELDLLEIKGYLNCPPVDNTKGVA